MPSTLRPEMPSSLNQVFARVMARMQRTATRAAASFVAAARRPWKASPQSRGPIAPRRQLPIPGTRASRQQPSPASRQAPGNAGVLLAPGGGTSGSAEPRHRRERELLWNAVATSLLLSVGKMVWAAATVVR